MLAIKQGTRLPIGMLVSLLTTFRCTLCYATVKPPLIVTRCCKNILGCDDCVTKLYQGDGGMTMKCPICRTDRAFAESSRINGLDDFLKKIYPLVDSPLDSDIDEYDNIKF